MYQLIIDPMLKTVLTVKRIADNTFIPMAEDNTDYQAYLAWVAEGGVPEPADEVTGG